jgi:hypothetical protein
MLKELRVLYRCPALCSILIWQLTKSEVLSIEYNFIPVEAIVSRNNQLGLLKSKRKKRVHTKLIVFLKKS